MMLISRVRLGLVVATAAATVLGGTTIAEAATSHTPLASRSPARAAGAPIGVGSSAPAIAPDGGRITTLPGTPEGAAARTAATTAASPGWYVSVNAANIRDWVPNGRIVKTAHYGDGGWIGCKIPNGAYTWGWVHTYIGGRYYEGWMRSDLYTVVPTASQPSTYVPWCG